MTLSKSCHQVFQVFQVFQVLHLTLCPASPPPEHNFLVFLHFSGTCIAMIRQWLTHVFKCKRKFCGLFIFRSHQLLIVWKVSRRLTWESLGRRLQKILRMLQKNQVLLKNFQINIKSWFLDEYQESLGDRLGKNMGSRSFQFAPKQIPAQNCRLKKVFSSPPSRPRIGLQWGQRTVGSRRSLWNNCHVKRWTGDKIGGQKAISFQLCFEMLNFCVHYKNFSIHGLTQEDGWIRELDFSAIFIQILRQHLIRGIILGVNRERGPYSHYCQDIHSQSQNFSFVKNFCATKCRNVRKSGGVGGGWIDVCY